MDCGSILSRPWGESPIMADVKMRRSGIAALVLVLVASGCSGRHQPTQPEPASVSGSSQVIRLESAGRDRQVIVHRPAGDPGAAGYPLVVMLHGGLGSAAQAESSYGWDALADRVGFVVAYPDGVDRTWNAGTCCGGAQRAEVDDVAFLTEMVDQVSAVVPIDAKRRYLTGMSNGAMMTYRMACESSLFVAIAPVAGTQLVDCTGASPTAVLHIHGADDSQVRPDGKRGAGPGRVDGPPLTQVIEGWRTRDDCAAPRRSVSGAVTTTTAECADGRTVTWIMIAGAGHQWPGSKRSTYPGADSPSQAVDATARIWDFFDGHR